jgi:hypothetical protein
LMVRSAMSIPQLAQRCASLARAGQVWSSMFMPGVPVWERSSSKRRQSLMNYG